MHVSHLALSENRCTVQIAGCNFKCRGCFSSERHTRAGSNITPAALAKQIPRDREEVMLAGGEPTLYRKELPLLIDKLDRQKIIISTNGYLLLDQQPLENLRGVTIHIDLKALNPALHRWYTGKDNQSVLTAIERLYGLDFEFEVNTVYIPGAIEKREIEDIASFLSDIGDINYKITRYVPIPGFSRRPEVPEIKEAVRAAKIYLSSVSSSLENRSHPASRQIIKLP